MAAAAVEGALRNPKDHGVGEPQGLFNFKEFCSLIGFDEMWDFERKWVK